MAISTGQRVVVRRGDVVLHGLVIGPLREGGALPGTQGRVIDGAIVVRVDRSDWPQIPQGSYDVPGIMPGTRGNAGCDSEFRDVIVRGSVDLAP